MNSKPIGNRWALQVVRGREPGRVFALTPGETVLGHAPGEPRGIDLAGQEAENSPRRMAARHAAVEGSNGSLTVRDLESPGGTFVNRQRVLPGQARPLALGDLIQLGAVQLRVVEAHGSKLEPAREPEPAAITPSARPGAAFAYAIPGGPTCRSWDDVLTASAQRWGSLREELISGRLAGFLASIGRADLIPPPASPGSPDERLDAWLGLLPATRPSRPELDVHPVKLLVRVTPGGGSARRVIRVANVGLRLLRSTARIEPPGTAWLAVAPEFAGRTFATVEETELALEIAIPETLPAPLTAEVFIEGDGGSKRVAVTIEAKGATIDPFETGGAVVAPVGVTLADRIARQSPRVRLASWPLVAVALRLLVGVVGGSIGEDGMTASGPDVPSLGRVAWAMLSLGAISGGVFATRRGGAREAPTGAFAGGCAGVVASTALVAACRAVEPHLGPGAASIVSVGLLWGLIGGALAALSIVFIKEKTR